MVDRTRSFNNLTRPSATGSVTLCPPGGTTTSTRLGPNVGTAKVMTDVVQPGFKTLSSKGTVFNNPMSKETQTCSYSGAQSWTVTKISPCAAGRTSTETFPYYFTALYGVQPTTYTARIDASSAITSAITEAYAGVAEPDLQGLVSLAELKKTIAMLRNPFLGLRTYLDQFKPRNLGKGSKKRSAKAQAESVAQQWLEYRYGIIPLMMDIEGVLKALRKHKSNRFTSRATRVTTPFSSDITVAGTGFYPHNVRTKIDETVTVRAGVYYEHYASLDERLGLSISDVPAAMWELVPYSFVVDWFLNVGHAINALTPRAGCRDLSAWYSIKRVHTIERSYTNFALPMPAMADYSLSAAPAGSDKVIFETTSRVPVTRSDIGLSATFSLSNTHVGDAIALAIGALSRASNRATLRT